MNGERPIGATCYEEHHFKALCQTPFEEKERQLLLMLCKPREV